MTCKGAIGAISVGERQVKQHTQNKDGGERERMEKGRERGRGYMYRRGREEGICATGGIIPLRMQLLDSLCSIMDE